MFLPPTPEHPPVERTPHELVVPRHDVQWCRPIFRAPTLASPQQWQREKPFSGAFLAKRFPVERRSSSAA